MFLAAKTFARMFVTQSKTAKQQLHRASVSYWNWYGFPSVYIGGYMLIQIIGFFVVGVVAAFVLRKTSVRVAS